MGHLTQSAHRLFATQHGVASVEQLVDAGLTRRRIKDLESHGTIVSVVRGAYRSASVDLDELGRSAAVCLARPDVVIAGPTAGRIWGFRRLPRDHRVHVVAPPASNPAIAPWVCTYRTAAIHDHDVVQRADGIRITTRARTAFDLSRWLGPDDLLSVIEQAIRDGGLTEVDMFDVAADWLSSQRRWAYSFLRQLSRRLGGGPADSHPEVRFAVALQQLGITDLVRQHRVQLPGYGTAHFDLAVPRLHLGDRARHPPDPRGDDRFDVRSTARPGRGGHRMVCSPRHPNRVRGALRRTRSPQWSTCIDGSNVSVANTVPDPLVRCVRQ